MVNWELHDGSEVERFVAALILLTNPAGNRITPSRGDRGIDVIVNTPDGADIFQIKRYSRPLTTAQRREVERSWVAVRDRVLPFQQVRSWTVVMPWDPSNERREWQKSLCTTHPDIEAGWLGRTQLDVLAAVNPKVVDYFFGNGQDRTARLMTQALSGSARMPAEAHGADLLLGIAEREDALLDLLNEVDPFYRCEREVRYGAFPMTMHEARAIESRGAALVTFQSRGPDRYVVLRWIPLSVESQWLRPISVTLNVDAELGTPQREMVEQFAKYGAPIVEIQGEMTHTRGPGAADPGLGRGVLSMEIITIGSSLPDLEVRVLGPDSILRKQLELTHPESTRSPVGGPGVRLTARDRSGFLGVEMWVGVPEDPQRLSVNHGPIEGLTPGELLPAVELCAEMTPGTQIEIGVRGGGPAVSAPWTLESTPEVINAATVSKLLTMLCENLLEVQRHSFDRIVVPDDYASAEWMQHVHEVAELLRGELVVIPADRMIKWDQGTAYDGAVQLVVDVSVSVKIGGRAIDTGVASRWCIPAAHVVVDEDLQGDDGPHLAALDGAPFLAICQKVSRDSGWVAGRAMVMQQTTLGSDTYDITALEKWMHWVGGEIL